MAKSYSEFNRRETVFEPNLIRQRLNFMGPIPSEILNLYYDQFVLDYNILNIHAEELLSKINDLNKSYGSNMSSATPDYYTESSIDATVILNSIYFDRQSRNYILSEATPFYQADLTINKVGINSSKLSKLMSKMLMLENLIGKEE